MRTSILAAVMLVTACSAPPGGMTARITPEVTVLPSGVQIPAVLPDKLDADCDPTASYRPTQPPGLIPPGSTMARIRDRDRLIVGIGSSAYGLSFRDPHDGGKVKGFEAEIVRAIAFAIFGDRDRVQFRALNTADRIAAVRGRRPDGTPVDQVDMVLAAMTMTCERWKDVAFSAEYYSAGQRVLVPKGSGVSEIEDLGGRKVCASATSTNLRSIVERNVHAIPVAAANTSDCLLLLQQGRIDAVSTGDVILAGLAAQDPTMEITGRRFTTEPTGIAMSHDAKDLVRFVNGVLDGLRASGEWNRLEATWLAPQLRAPTDPVPQPPVPRYQPE